MKNVPPNNRKKNKQTNKRPPQKPSLFNAILDMAALDKTSGSRTGSVSIDNGEGVNSQTHLLYVQQPNGNHAGNGPATEDHEGGTLANLARRSTMRKRSFR